ncbi:hypothetical protein PRIPAC_93298 [Pristionchus pacificus]|uniref:Uncharacterized protein n=1 Tax=Pristionchus pacificus TaxID=54126 RepID=A0A2A6CDE4_PRIPA|nr:hypothetical protein PRIPAC_93298 [Pristionchus pacificus]|eukprot:PDM76129.1 hypothetical protein PRIPAC_39733 [Pristionchus pacificus]
MSLFDSIARAKSDLRKTEVQRTLEDGSCIVEKRSADGAFVAVEEESLPTVAEEPTVAGDGAPTVSKRRARKVERARRLGFVVDLKPDLQCACVAPGVFMGSQDVAADLQILRANQITHIVNAATGIQCFHDKHFKYHLIKILDDPSEDIKSSLFPALDFMRHAVESGGAESFFSINTILPREINQLVFVHCNAGISRSSTVCIAYLIHYANYTVDSAIAHIKTVRPVIRPNEGFLVQLRSFEQESAQLKALN